MATREQYEAGLKVEKEHERTYKWLAKYLKDHKGKMPSPTDFYLHISADHLQEFPDYYIALAKMEKELKQKSDS